MTVQLLEPDEVLGALVLCRDDVAQAAHFLRGQPGVHQGRQAARLESVAATLDLVVTNLRQSRRDR